MIALGCLSAQRSQRRVSTKADGIDPDRFFELRFSLAEAADELQGDSPVVVNLGAEGRAKTLRFFSATEGFHCLVETRERLLLLARVAEYGAKGVQCRNISWLQSQR